MVLGRRPPPARKLATSPTRGEVSCGGGFLAVRLERLTSAYTKQPHRSVERVNSMAFGVGCFLGVLFSFPDRAVEDAAKSLHVPEGYVVTVVAAAPRVVNAAELEGGWCG